MLFLCFPLIHKIDSCTTSLSINDEIYNIEKCNFIYALFFYFSNTGCIHFLSFGDTRSPDMFGSTDFKNYCIVACEYWHFCTCGSSGGVHFRNKKRCIASFLINELSHRLDLILELKAFEQSDGFLMSYTVKSYLNMRGQLCIPLSGFSS